ncbi:I66 family serine proteinase inhibitor [Streptosporangium carneum]|uniref:Uncharacterized protein n=1 Tax=Streptosporangium carneum TaxID=47481 RepID=A0A9W6IB54_9ACTN|nr:I66 family serine proteinase inhibitor [Streptosporangium carneum]GLK14811.1 hypothetical protein GCM10017600_82230 [Streptosporangium carneum]
MRLTRVRPTVLAALLAALLAAVLAPGPPAASADGADLVSLPSRVVLRIGGAHVVNIHDRVFAALLPAPPATGFRVIRASGGVRLQDENTGGLVYASTTEPFTQLLVSEPDQAPPNSVFAVESPPSDEADDLTPEEADDVAWIATIRLAGTDQYIGRHFAEDRSLLPKKVLLLPPGVHAPLFVIQPAG